MRNTDIYICVDGQIAKYIDYCSQANLCIPVYNSVLMVSDVTGLGILVYNSVLVVCVFLFYSVQCIVIDSWCVYGSIQYDVYFVN